MKIVCRNLTFFLLLLIAATARAQTTAPARTAPAASDPLLGPVFESRGAGIALRGPAGAKPLRRTGSDEVVQFVNEDKKWTLTVTRAQLGKSVALTGTPKPDGTIEPGLLDESVKQIQMDKPGVTILRNDAISLGDTPVGMIAAKYTLGLDTILMQEALVRVTGMNYFVITLTSPVPRGGGELDDDPGSRAAVENFSAILDSVRLLDQSALLEEQSQRLFRTRTFLMGLGEQKLRSVLVPVQWLRIIENGKDIGYTYVVEEVARDLPRKNVRPERQAGPEGVLIGVRSRTSKDGTMVDSESWMFCAYDRRNESWSTIALVDDPKAGRTHLSELGVSTMRKKPIPDKGSVLKDGNKGITVTDDYVLSVTQFGKSATPEPVTQQLVPWYLPQALGHLLPRLLPRNEPKTFLFGSYVSQQGKVMSRYIDVGREETFTINGQNVRAIPVHDRIALEGSVTTHYISADGKYLGSVNTDTDVTVLPTDAATLEKLWKDANLTRPGAVEEK